MRDFADIAALTFDCYGTLVDWESGILGAVKGVLSRRGVVVPSDGELLQMYAAIEAAEETGEYWPYREVLAATMTEMARRCGAAELNERERAALAESLPRWPVFADTRAFLEAAGKKYTLCICSNIDDDLFAGTRRTLGARLDWVVTAQYCRSYKPGPRHFRVALALMDLRPERVLHVAESRRHDVEPAKRLGFRTVWVNRHQDRPGPSASGEAGAAADLEVRSLEELGRAMGLDMSTRSE